MNKFFADWKKDLGKFIITGIAGLVCTSVYTVVQGKNLNETFTNVWKILGKQITLPLHFFLLVAVVVYLVIKVKRLYYKSEKNVQIGNFTFAELYKFMSFEYISPRNAKSKFTILGEYLIDYYLLLQGVKDDESLLAKCICPELLTWGLVEKKNIDGKWQYIINDNGKKFWSILQKIKYAKYMGVKLN